MLLPGGFKDFLFSPLFGEDSHFDEHVFQMGWFNHQLEHLPNLHFEVPLICFFLGGAMDDQRTGGGWFQRCFLTQPKGRNDLTHDNVVSTPLCKTNKTSKRDVS